ncbi:solute carrier family 13 member 4 isoform X2 [Antechinus flavipes]|uniref:solute carrier family 13 member 4 isoform X2 n=1 Tax=Antechinus flavipes TaxID=38775 RepID=UPI0022365901|nr:solute carrier family 13 member 4 isoform X2 [Antechinus flavipes]
MAFLKELFKAKNLLLVIFIPLLLLPLPILHPNSEAACAYVLIVTAVYWVSEAVPLGAAALVPAFLYPLLGVLRSSEVAAEYFKNTTLLLVGVICVAAAVEKWNLHKRIALRMVMMAGAKPGMLLLCFMCCTTLLSMWLSNTSTTAMVMPIVEAVLQELVSAEEEQVMAAPGNSSSEETEPISLHEKNGPPSLELIFVNEDSSAPDFPSLMQGKNLNGVPMISNSIQSVKPQSKRQCSPQERLLVLPPGNLELSGKYRSQHDHMVCKCLSLSISYAATIGGLTTIIGTSTSLIFLEHFNNQYPNAEVVNFGTWFLFSFPISLIMLVVSWFWMHWLFLGCNFKETCSLSKKKKTKREELSERRIQAEYEKLGDISYPEMVTGFFFILMTLLWFTREPGFVPGWDSFFEKKGYRTDATVSVFLGFLLFLIPAKKPCFGKKDEDSGESREDSMEMEPIITWKDFQKTMPWEIVILVGGGYALASGSKSSGLSTWIGHQMLSLSSLPPWAVTLLACILVSVVTEFVSNPATITIFLPILCSLSETLHINPLYTLIPVTMCISFAVMLPVGNPPNAIVFSYGHCQIKDMVKAGLGVNIIGLVVVMVAINTWGINLFHLDTFPVWAKVSNTTHQA